MRIESIRAVKAKLNQLVGSLPDEGSVVITKNGRPCAVLMPVTEETDLEVVALSQNKEFWRLYEEAARRGEREGFTPLDELVEAPAAVRPRPARHHLGSSPERSTSSRRK